MQVTTSALLHAASQRTLVAFQQFEEECCKAPHVVDVNYIEARTLYNGLVNSLQEVYDHKQQQVDAHRLVSEHVEDLLTNKQLFVMWYGNWQVVKDGEVIVGFARQEPEQVVRATVISGVVQCRPVARTELH